MTDNKPNHLIHEKSPYLLQHAYNPVEWFPWSEIAFEKAKKENKPILVSIGYSTCHWCHVMERESFSDTKIAEIMNQYLVCIKIDREERPDIDKIYMTAVMAMTESGGWPLNVFLTPDLKPFFGGTYFPPDDRWGRIGWPKLVERVGKMWQDSEERKKIINSATNLTQQLQQYLSEKSPDGDLDSTLLDNGFKAYQLDFDSQLGGFGRAPKFPMPVNHNFLLRYYAYAKDKIEEEKRNNAKIALEMSSSTLRAMAEGGIYDQLGGGFHRYSTDERWHVPHFEKMLYDNAQLIINYLDAYQITHDPFFSEIAKETLKYILRDMTRNDGGFYSAEDADSLAPSRSAEREYKHHFEGAFYVWEKKEILEFLGQSDGEIFSFRYGIKKEGNVESDPQGEFENKNILYISHSISDTAKKFSKTENEVLQTLNECKKKLFETRQTRPRPHLDDKILVSWNGLMISALARAYQIFSDTKYLRQAEQTATFIQNQLYDFKERQLYRRWRESEKKIKGTADDYAFLIQGLIDIYEAGFNPNWLKWSIELTEEQNQRFFDKTNGGFFMTAHDHDKNLIVRAKEDSDNVEPSASSVAALNLFRLAEFTNRNDFRQMAEKTLKFYASQIKTAPRSLPQMLAALTFSLSKPCQIIITGSLDSPHTKKLLQTVHDQFIPNKILIVLYPEKSQDKMAQFLPFLKTVIPINNQPTAYVCTNYTCKLPTNDPEILRKTLNTPNLVI